MIWYFGPDSSEIVFTLLTKVVTFYVGLTMVYIEEISHQKSLTWAL